MKFTSSSGKLLKQLEMVNGIINTKTKVPLLDYILFEVEDGILTVTTSDLEMSLTSSMRVEAIENGRIAVHSQLIIGILKELSEQKVLFDIYLENKTVNIIGDKDKYKLQGESIEDFLSVAFAQTGKLVS